MDEQPEMLFSWKFGDIVITESDYQTISYYVNREDVPNMRSIAFWLGGRIGLGPFRSVTSARVRAALWDVIYQFDISPERRYGIDHLPLFTD